MRHFSAVSRGWGASSHALSQRWAAPLHQQHPDDAKMLQVNANMESELSKRISMTDRFLQLVRHLPVCRPIEVVIVSAIRCDGPWLKQAIFGSSSCGKER